METSALLRIPFALNILILVPVVWSMFAGPSAIGSVFEGKLNEAQGLRLLVASLWFAIFGLLCNGLGLAAALRAAACRAGHL